MSKRNRTAMPPVHPALVHYPIALVTLSVIADVIGFIVGSQSLQNAALWALLGAAIAGAFTLMACRYCLPVYSRQPKYCGRASFPGSFSRRILMLFVTAFLLISYREPPGAYENEGFDQRLADVFRFGPQMKLDCFSESLRRN